MTSRPSVSIITPTGRRETLLQLQHGNVLRQTVQDFEWLILDDSPAPSAFFAGLDDPRIRYQHHAGPRLTIGEKRNRLIQEAAGDIIMHFDDDDFYAPQYLECMQMRLAKGADAAKLSAFFVYDLFLNFLGYWDTALRGKPHYHLSSGSVKIIDLERTQSSLLNGLMEQFYLGYGFSYVYRKAIWEKIPFQDRDLGEDQAFLKAARDCGFRLDIFPDTMGLSLHIRRADNASEWFPQFVLPEFMLARIFGPEVLPMAGF